MVTFSPAKSLRKAARRMQLELEWPVERVIAYLARRSAGSERVGHILLAGPGQGSVGDEAMYQAFVRSVDAPATVIARDREDLLQQPEPVALFRAMPALLYGRSSFKRFRALRALLDLAARSKSVSVIGADVMDGVYNEASSVRRFRTAALAGVVGSQSRVLGFSWNESPTPATVRAMLRTAGRAELLLRDERSMARIVAHGAKNAIQVADLAFLVEPSPADIPDAVTRWVSIQREANRKVIVVNANPRLEGRFPNQQDQYDRLIRALLDLGASVILLPHDSRGGSSSELAYTKEMGARHAGCSEVLTLDSVYLPAQIAAISGISDFVISGRMHLVILSAVAGTPSVGLEYQGKFSGLYDLLGFQGAIRAPESGVGWDLAAEATQALTQAPEHREALRRALPAAISRARRNLPAGTHG